MDATGVVVCGLLSSSAALMDGDFLLFFFVCVLLHCIVPLFCAYAEGKYTLNTMALAALA